MDKFILSSIGNKHLFKVDLSPLQYMKACDSVYAAGDIVRFHLPLIDGETNIGHWQIAHNHGQYSVTLE